GVQARRSTPCVRFQPEATIRMLRARFEGSDRARDLVEIVGGAWASAVRLAGFASTFYSGYTTALRPVAGSPGQAAASPLRKPPHALLDVHASGSLTEPARWLRRLFEQEFRRARGGRRGRRRRFD